MGGGGGEAWVAVCHRGGGTLSRGARTVPWRASHALRPGIPLRVGARSFRVRSPLTRWSSVWFEMLGLRPCQRQAGACVSPPAPPFALAQNLRFHEISPGLGSRPSSSVCVGGGWHKASVLCQLVCVWGGGVNNNTIL